MDGRKEDGLGIAAQQNMPLRSTKRNALITLCICRRGDAIAAVIESGRPNSSMRFLQKPKH
jgi:hypothetical protein